MGRPTKEQQVAITERRRRAIELRNEGRPWHEIADQLGYATPAAAVNDVTRARAAAYAELRTTVEEWRDRSLADLDTLRDAALEVLVKRHVFVSGGKVVRDAEIVQNEDGTWSINGDPTPLTDDGPALQAIDRVLKVEESRRKLLGLDAPQKVETSGTIRYSIDGIEPEALT